jgi:hypothetical protein
MFTTAPEYTNCIVYNWGHFPKPIRPVKDLLLPFRMFPNAKIWNVGLFNKRFVKHQKNRVWFNSVFPKDREWEFADWIPEGLDPANTVLFVHFCTYNIFGGQVTDLLIRQEQIIAEWPGKVYVFYNDELLTRFESFRTFIATRTHLESFRKKNEKHLLKLDAIPEITDWGRITLLGNQNLIKNWLDNKCKRPLPGLVKEYLSDLTLYAIDPSGFVTKPSTEKRGVYISLLTTPRIAVIDSIFGTASIDIQFKGSKSNELTEAIRGDGEFVDNVQLPTVLKQYDWSIYIGKGKASEYLGATFYEPLLAGIPILIWKETDKNCSIFPDIDCYFETADDVKRILASESLPDMHRKQVQSVLSRL